MNSNERIAMDDEDGIDLLALCRLAWSYKYLVLLTVIAGASVALFFALTARSIYRAEAVITEVRENSMGGAAELANQFGGLASLAGVNLGGGGKSQEAQAILKSRHLVEEFIVRNKLMPVLHSDGPPQSLWRAVQVFRKNILSFRDDKRAGTTVVVVNWTDPAQAARWANELVALSNEILRTRAMDDSKRSIAYLNDQVVRTNVVELHRVMYNIIESETKTLMFANARAEYAFAIVDPAVPPEVRVSPKRTTMVLFGIVIGLFAGLAIAFAHSRSVQIKRKAAPVGT